VKKQLEMPPKHYFGENEMTCEDKGRYAKKHSPERKVGPEIAEAVKQKASHGRIACAAAHQIAEKLNVPPSEVGFTIDFFEIRIEKCRLGLYGYRPEKKIVKPAKTVPKRIEDAIRGSLDNDRLTCKAAWEIAKRLGIIKMEISSACEALNIRISSCQLGSF